MSSTPDRYRTSVQKSNFEGKYDASSIMVTTASALAIYSSLEMVLLISTTFKRWQGLYFWSLTLCNLGVLMYTVGFMMLYYQLGPLWLMKTFNDTGWIGMVVCQSLVLYSRLGLVVFNEKILQAVKWMIIVDSAILVPLPIIFDFGTTYTDDEVYPRGYFYIEPIQVTVFSVQECIISGLYVFKAVVLLKSMTKANARGIIWQLLILNLVIVPMDISVMVMQFLKLQLFQEGIKVFVYAVKLKFELHILSKLVDFIHDNGKQRAETIDIIDSDTLAGQGRVDLRQAMPSWGTDGARSMSEEKGSIDFGHIENSPTSPAAGSIDRHNITQSANDSNATTDASSPHAGLWQRLKGKGPERTNETNS